MIKRLSQTITSLVISLVLVFTLPLSAWADDSQSGTDSAASTSEQAPAPEPEPTSNELPAGDPPAGSSSPTQDQNSAGPTSPTGPTSPGGASGNSYVYNSQTGLWENDYYTWDPVTHQTSPKYFTGYSYNPETGMWDTTKWVWDAAAGKYVPNTKSVKTNPNAINNSGPGSINGIGNNSSFTGIYDRFYDVRISNSLMQLAGSGNASVNNNTLGGSATSGNAMDIINIINLLQASWDPQLAGDLMTFVANIDGDVVGDLVLNPAQINNSGPGSLNNVNSQRDTNITINSQGNGLIANDVTLGAGSGDATVANNTLAGSATTGNADAVANIINIINSVIYSGKSFLGVININGNFDGDILLPPDFIDQLIASGAPNATINILRNQTTNVDINTVSNQTIANQVELTAASGNANVNNNTLAGGATSGSAVTNLTIFNLTGRQIIGANSLLVFVNVLGKWVGLIVDAPVGANSAAFCGGNCTISDNSNTNIKVNDESNNAIINNLRINSETGDALVSNNTEAGSATSGNASASANIMNINHSQLSLTHWFGMLFINVLGTWHGSFGINTDAGTIKQLYGGIPNNSQPAQVFAFVPGGSGNPSTDMNQLFQAVEQSQNNQNQTTNIAGATKGSNTPNSPQAQAAKPTTNWKTPIISSLVVFGLFGLAAAAEYFDNAKIWLLNRKFSLKSRRPKAWLRFTLF